MGRISVWEVSITASVYCEAVSTSLGLECRGISRSVVVETQNPPSQGGLFLLSISKQNETNEVMENEVLML